MKMAWRSKVARTLEERASRLRGRRVAVTGLGLVTPLAVGALASWDLLTQGASGIRKLVREDIREAQDKFDRLAVKIGGCVSDAQLEEHK